MEGLLLRLSALDADAENAVRVISFFDRLVATHATLPQVISQATTPVADMVRGVTPDQLRLPTPCPDFDVRRLLNHLLYWGPSLEGAARKVLVPPPDTPEAERELP
ncbi:maleylpyruvate isomerase N-terminal domain-containing protein, partial [Kibdelosporangium lantanae]